MSAKHFALSMFGWITIGAVLANLAMLVLNGWTFGFGLATLIAVGLSSGAYILGRVWIKRNTGWTAKESEKA